MRRLVAVVLAASLSAGSLLAQTAPSTTENYQYLIRAGDVLRIRVWPDPNIGGEFPVEENGMVYLPVLGEMEASGRALADFRKDLRQLYGEFLKQPAVSVTPLFQVSLLGAVVSPGIYQLNPTHTLVDAISIAGGFTDNAKADDLRILRHGQVIEFPTGDLLELGGADLRLQSGDRVIVPAGSRVNWRDVVLILQTMGLATTLISRW